MQKILLVLAFSTLAVAAPSQPQKQTLASLTKLEKAWKVKNIKNYSYEVDILCFCANRPHFEYFVHNDIGVVWQGSSGFDDKGNLKYSSIDKLYGIMKNNVSKKGTQVRLVQDAVDHFPITIDIDVGGSDAGYGIRISNFKKR
jgi:Family of unknown function (DUF6174)